MQTLQQAVQQVYDSVTSQLSQIITLEITQRDEEALTVYDALLLVTDNEIKSMQQQYNPGHLKSSSLSPLDRVSWDSLLRLRGKVLERRNNVEQRLKAQEPLILSDETQRNARSYSSFMSAFPRKGNSNNGSNGRANSTATDSSNGKSSSGTKDATGQKALSPKLRNVEEFKKPAKPQRVVSASSSKATADITRARCSLELPRRSLDIQRKAPSHRKDRPKSIDLTISQAAVLAWQENSANHENSSSHAHTHSTSTRRVTPPIRSASPIHTNARRKYEYVQPTVNTQINLTPVHRSKSPPPSSSSAQRKKKVPIPQTEGNVVARSPNPNDPPQKKKVYSDPRIEKVMDELHGVDRGACEQILDEILFQGEKLHWDDLAGLEAAKTSLKETVVYPFLRPDLFKGLREPVTGMLLFGPPGTGKTMIAKTVANESQSTFFSISASSLLSKYLGESEKLIRALFYMAKRLSPSIIFFDEIDSLLTARGDGENESSRRVKTEFLIQWSGLSSSTAREDGDDKPRVLVLAATNLPWAIDEAARRRFSRRLYIPLPEFDTRLAQLRKLCQSQKSSLSETDFIIIANQTKGYSNSDITALAKEAAMEPIRDLGENLMSIDYSQIRGLCLEDFEKAMRVIRRSVAPETLKRFEEWAARYGSTGV